MIRFKIFCVLLLCIFVVDGWTECRPAASRYSISARPRDVNANIAVGSQDYSVNDRGAIAFDTSGSGGSVGVGYATLQPTSGVTPSAYLTFQFRENNIL